MGVSLFNYAAINDIIERLQEVTVASPRYEAKALQGFITPRWNLRKRMEVRLIDFNRDGAGLTIPVPAWEQGDDVCLHVRATNKPELKLTAMPANVRYRITWNGEYRIGLQFKPQSSLLREDHFRLQASALESYLAEINECPTIAVYDNLAQDQAIAASEPSY
ncbi:PilZ domain-containing protein [Marinobacter salicampi]|uniref:PilZ domain-containing protein n=1 Tax=Marinobacter salicampi TaxID=435907 RepID=UPI001409225D|nr:PilZ domain-containing protein [Marinobacter salicampi]